MLTYAAAGHSQAWLQSSCGGIPQVIPEALPRCSAKRFNPGNHPCDATSCMSTASIPFHKPVSKYPKGVTRITTGRSVTHAQDAKFHLPCCRPRPVTSRPKAPKHTGTFRLAAKLLTARETYQILRDTTLGFEPYGALACSRGLSSTVA